MAEVDQKIVQISGHGRVHKAFGGAGVLKPPRENAHAALSAVGRCQGVGDDGHSDDCNHATNLLIDLRALLGPSTE